MVHRSAQQAAYRQLVTTQLKITLREPANLFFSLIFGPMLVLVLGLIFGNSPRPEFHGLGYLDGALAPFAAMVVAIVGLMSVPIDIVTQRESGTLSGLTSRQRHDRFQRVSEIQSWPKGDLEERLAGALLVEVLEYREPADVDNLEGHHVPAGKDMLKHLIRTAAQNQDRPGIVQAYAVLSAKAVTTDQRPLGGGPGRPQRGRSQGILLRDHDQIEDGWLERH